MGKDQEVVMVEAERNSKPYRPASKQNEQLTT